MINTAKIEKQLEAVYSLLEKLTPAEREIITDKLLAYLLFPDFRVLTPKIKN